MSSVSRTMPRTPHEASGKFRERSLFDREQWGADIQTRFETFDRDHPEVWRLFQQFAGALLAAGHKHYSADDILHRIRWHYAVERRADAAVVEQGGFKINDHFSSRYARKLAKTAPARFAEFFEFRSLTS